MSICHPAPTLTEKNLPSQVFIVTGSSSGFGKELAKILYQRDAKVYVATRSETKALAAIDEIRTLSPNSKGELVYLHLDLNDLAAVKRSAQEFMSKESRLDVLWNNAGVMLPAEGSTTAQGYELQLGVNTIASFAFSLHLRPIMAATAKTAPKNSVRVAWVASIAAKEAPKPPIDFSNLNYERKDESQWMKYRRSKAGMVMLAAEYARRTAGEGISLEPGVAKTDLQRNMPVSQRLLVSTFGFEPKKGAYTQLFAGLSPEVTANSYGLWGASQRS
ncbi:hypothetical protein DL764_009381 [Monosporascus ibericus]|uniref:Short-chain dehydrogenase n=1 Tax=Monosporascus ibericus TaxID=155417 RepID=A0A4Q4SV69_9PEZI|nr:hypothetical protein DL764_009381 [Monosporascus ibericus]